MKFASLLPSMRIINEIYKVEKLFMNSRLPPFNSLPRNVPSNSMDEFSGFTSYDNQDQLKGSTEIFLQNNSASSEIFMQNVFSNFSENSTPIVPQKQESISEKVRHSLEKIKFLENALEKTNFEKNALMHDIQKLWNENQRLANENYKINNLFEEANKRYLREKESREATSRDLQESEKQLTEKEKTIFEFSKNKNALCCVLHPPIIEELHRDHLDRLDRLQRHIEQITTQKVTDENYLKDIIRNQQMMIGQLIQNNSNPQMQIFR